MGRSDSIARYCLIVTFALAWPSVRGASPSCGEVGTGDDERWRDRFEGVTSGEEGVPGTKEGLFAFGIEVQGISSFRQRDRAFVVDD